MPWRAACLPPDGVVGGNSPIGGDDRGEKGKAARGVTATPVAGANLAYRCKWKMISTVSQAIRDLQLHIF